MTLDHSGRDFSATFAPGEDRLLTTEQVAEVIEYSAGTLANWRVEGIGPKYISHRGRVRYRASDVQAWIREL